MANETTLTIIGTLTAADQHPLASNGPKGSTVTARFGSSVSPAQQQGMCCDE